MPDFWAERQRDRESQAKQHGCFSNKAKDDPSETKRGAGDADGGDSFSAESALVQIATHAMEKMTQALRGREGVEIPLAERAAFAKAVKGAMDALAKQS